MGMAKTPSDAKTKPQTEPADRPARRSRAKPKPSPHLAALEKAVEALSKIDARREVLLAELDALTPAREAAIKALDEASARVVRGGGNVEPLKVARTA